MMNELEHILSKRYKQEALFRLFQRYFVDWIADAYIAKDMNIFEISAINEKTDKEVLVKFLAEFYGNEEIFKKIFETLDLKKKELYIDLKKEDFKTNFGDYLKFLRKLWRK